ncbi:hypothetical protein [Bacillus massilinigeriensis]|uniref:hypothetical protein n=1 Tax=Bacillus massilionigeriensis TaxID=1805475 RepID=UPI00096AEDA5|nr:hypothetical protein [Bacillus massilionigeriensis]
MNKMKLLPYGTGILLSFVGIGAVAAGGGFIIDSSGSGLGMSVEILENSPFESFLIPGIFLLILNGIGSLIGAIFAFKNFRYSGISTIILGIIMIIWISIQVFWIGWISWLQPTFLVIGAMELLLGYFLNVRKVGNHEVFPHRHHGTGS